MYLRPKFANYEALRQADFPALYRSAEFRVNVVTKIRRTGLQLRTMPIRPD
jgi:hypothetical protein